MLCHNAESRNTKSRFWPKYNRHHCSYMPRLTNKTIYHIIIHHARRIPPSKRILPAILNFHDFLLKSAIF